MIIRVKASSLMAKSSEESFEPLADSKPEMPEDSTVSSSKLCFEDFDLDLCCACNKQLESEPTLEMKIKLKEQQRIKEFISFNSISGELEKVSIFEGIVCIFELRGIKVLKDFPEYIKKNLSVCGNCAVMITQLYKLHKEFTRLLNHDSVISKMISHECSIERYALSNPLDSGLMPRVRNSSFEFATNPGEDDGFLPIGSAVNSEDEPDVDDYDNVVDDSGTTQQCTESLNRADAMENSFEETDVYMDIRPYEEPDLGVLSIDSAATFSLQDVFSRDDFPAENGSTKNINPDGRPTRNTARNVNYTKLSKGVIEDDSPKSPVKGKRKRGRPPSANSRRAKKAELQRLKKQQLKAVIAADHRPSKANAKTICPICSQPLCNNSYLKSHIATRHKDSHSCEICGKFFENEVISLKHMLSHVPRKSYPCPRCHTTFASNDDRDRHLILHPDRMQKLKCPECATFFTSILCLNKHEVLKHKKTRAYVCNLCAQVFMNKKEWINHILSHGPFKCPVASCKKFFHPEHLKSHLAAAHGENTNVPSPVLHPIKIEPETESKSVEEVVID